VLGSLAVAICVLSLVTAVPQVIHTWVSKTTDGISATAVLMNPISTLAWVGYFIWTAQHAALVADAVYLPGELLLLGIVLRAETRRTKPIVFSVAWLLCLSLAAAIGNPTTLSTFLAIGVAIQSGSSITAAVQSEALGGLSPWMWLLTLTQACAWGGYGVIAGNTGSIEWAVVAAAASLTILARWLSVASQHATSTVRKLP
jgi:uncharacterized protein with PQ loop repeat